MANNYAYLIQVNAVANNNKFYEITENNNGSLDVSYGRIGGRTMAHHYESFEKDFFGLKDEKERKGYEDRTALHSEIKRDTSAVKELSFAPVPDEAVQDVLEQLINSSREFMQNNYTVKPTDITEKMINEAMADIDALNHIASDCSGQNALYQFNNKLQELFTDVPRNMGHVSEYLAKTERDFTKIIDRETDMLQNVKGAIVQAKTTTKEKQGKDQTVLEAYGLTMRPVTYKEEDQITSHLGYDYDGRQVENRFIKAYAVENTSTRKSYEDYKQKNHMTGKDVRLFYHGSKVENWYSIMKTGLSLNPNATVTGKMFGQGLYFAPECRKALNYMDVAGSHWNSGTRQSGYCAIYAVALGKCYQPSRVLGSNFREKDLPAGTTSVYASKGSMNLRNDEYVVYNQSACTIKYLVEMAEQRVRTKEFNLDRDVLRNNIAKGLNTLFKTSDGVKAEIIIEQLPKAVQAELEAKVTKDFDCNRLYIDYNEKSDRISLDITTVNGNSKTIKPLLTNDDYTFLAREMKKAFVESENEWKELMSSTKEYALGKPVANKNGKIPVDVYKSREKLIIKE